jgi:hypothetical protein
LTGGSGACFNQNVSCTLNRILLLCEHFYSMEAVLTDLVKGKNGSVSDGQIIPLERRVCDQKA